MELTGKTAMVTGSTSGIGLGIARELAAAGADIVMNGLGDPAENERLRAGIEADYKVNCRYDAADMTKPEQIAAMVTAAAERTGRLEVLVNNAGIQHVAPVEDFPIAKWDAIIAINLSAAFHAIRAAVPLMKKQGWGRIINLASAHGLVASPFKSAYVSAKHGLVGLTKTVALELAESGITVNAICPGYVLTPLVQNQIADQAKARGMSEDEVMKKVILEAQPTKKFVTIEQVAAMARYLCSDAAAGITGAALAMDGGWTAR